MMLILHIITIIGTGLLVLFADEEALRYVLGKKERLSARTVSFLHYAVAAGLALIMITGGILYSRSPERYLSDPTFIIKMIALVALIVNSYFIDRFSDIAVLHSFASLPKRTRIGFLVSGAISVTAWIAAGICGLLL